MTTSVGTAQSDIQVLPQTESSTYIEDFARGPVFMAHGNGESTKSVEEFLGTIKGDYFVYIHGHENSSYSPITIPEAEPDALEAVGMGFDPAADFGVFNVRRYGPLPTPSPDLNVGHIGYQRQRPYDLWHAPLEMSVRFENVLKHEIDDKAGGTSPSSVGRYRVNRANPTLIKAFGLLANLSSDLGAGSVSYQKQTDDLFPLICSYSPGGVPDTDFNGHVLRRKYIRSALGRAFRNGSEEAFEYGMESKFSGILDSLIRSYSNDAVVEVERILAQADISLNVREECLLQLGAIEHNPTSQSRLSLLIDHLWSEQIGVRDCAALGIASMDDPSAIHPLQHAVRVEKSDRLRDDLQLVLDQLMATRNAQLLENHS